MAAEDGTGGLSSSFTDLMTSLAVIFILLLVALVNNKQQELQAKQEQLTAAQLEAARMQRELAEAAKATKETRMTILTALRKELDPLAIQGVEVKEDEKDPLGLLVVIPEGLLEFVTNQSDIPPNGGEFLREFTPRLANIACYYRGDLQSIVVEGHADSRGTDEHNLKLSQDRSIAVVRESLRVLERVQNDPASSEFESCFLDLLSASGRGRREPFIVDGVEDQNRSRRVVFKIRVRSFEQRKMIPIAAAIGGGQDAE